MSSRSPSSSRFPSRTGSCAAASCARTPGTLIEEQLLDGKQQLFRGNRRGGETSRAGLCRRLNELLPPQRRLHGEDAYDELLAELARIGPAEIVADVPSECARRISTRSRDGARLATPSPGNRRSALAFGVRRVFRSMSRWPTHRALEALGAFVRAHRRQQRSSALPVRPPALSAAAFRRRSIRHPQASASPRGRRVQNPRATLLATLDACATSMGLADARALDPRTAGRSGGDRRTPRRGCGAAGRAFRGGALSGSFLAEPSISNSISAESALSARDAARSGASLRRTLEILAPLRETAGSALAPLFERVGDFSETRSDLQQTLVDEPPAHLGEGGAIRPEASSELAECIALRGDTRSRISALEERERERTGIKTLKVKYASPFGYAIEVGKSYADAVPPEYVRKQTLTNGERYSTPELRELELAISTAQSRQERLEAGLFEALLERVAARADELLEAAGAIAEIDVLAALRTSPPSAATCAPRSCPRASSRSTTAVIRSWKRSFTRSLYRTISHLRAAERRFVLLTGPNMGGKSTYLRQTGLLAIMAQIGSFVPAKKMELGIVDRIFTRIGAGDDLASGQSTFYMEMAEAANILRRSTHRSLLLIDEVGRGTGTLDGLAIAQAICEFLLARGADAAGALRNALSRTLRVERALANGRQLSHHRSGGSRARRRAGFFASRSAGQLVAVVRDRSCADGRIARRRRRASPGDCRRALGRSRRGVARSTA